MNNLESPKLTKPADDSAAANTNAHFKADPHQRRRFQVRQDLAQLIAKYSKNTDDSSLWHEIFSRWKSGVVGQLHVSNWRSFIDFLEALCTLHARKKTLRLTQPYTVTFGGWFGQRLDFKTAASVPLDLFEAICGYASNRRKLGMDVIIDRLHNLQSSTFVFVPRADDTSDVWDQLIRCVNGYKALMEDYAKAYGMPLKGNYFFYVAEISRAQDDVAASSATSA